MFLRPSLQLNPRWLAQLAVGLVLLVGSACGSRTRHEPRPMDQNVLGAEELESTRQPTLFDAVRLARPLWFNSRSGTEGILVYQDDQPVGGLGVLRRMSVLTAARVVYMPPGEAQLRFGPRNGMRPAIVVETVR